MKLFSASQIKEWDQYTISETPISSIDLMENAAMVCCHWLMEQNLSKHSFKVFCGKGNNGGDGLAIARILHQSEWNVSVFILDSINKGSENFEINFSRFQSISPNLHFIQSSEDFPPQADDIFIDTLFGSGLNKPITGVASTLIDYLNQSGNRIISIDLPSGLFMDKSSIGNTIVRATNTLTFQSSKVCFMMAENAAFTGRVSILPIGLSEHFYVSSHSNYELVEPAFITSIYKPREEFSHKGDFGFACIIAGSEGMMGAAVLATRACLKSGAGKVVCITPQKGNTILQISAPEAMTRISGSRFIEEIPELDSYDSIGIGPGIGIHSSHKKLLSGLFKNCKKPLVIDADALNILSANKKLIELTPPNSIITPHPREFDRLFGECANDFERMEQAREKSNELDIYIVLKGHHTLITSPGNQGYFNSTGNAGMATGGSGDVLTGIITGLLAQGYSSLDACLLGVYIHGLAGDFAAGELSQESMLAGDIVNNIGRAFLEVK